MQFIIKTAPVRINSEPGYTPQALEGHAEDLSNAFWFLCQYILYIRKIMFFRFDMEIVQIERIVYRREIRSDLEISRRTTQIDLVYFVND